MSAAIRLVSALAAALAACGGDEARQAPPEVATDTRGEDDGPGAEPDQIGVLDQIGDTDHDGDADDIGDVVTDTSSPEVVAPHCAPGLAPGPYGMRRGEVAGDFELDLANGGRFRLSAVFTGCESFVFLTDRLRVSQLDPAPLWDSERDLLELLEDSPDDVHYLFVATGDPASAAIAIDDLQLRLEAVLAALESDLAAHWRDHVHVVSARAQDLDPESAWVGSALLAQLAPGFAIDHGQRIAGVGHLADVTRYDTALAEASAWPWRGNIAYAAHEAHYLRAEAAQREALAAARATRIEVFTGEVLSQFQETTVELPSAAELAAFDTLEVELTLRCPNPDLPEAGNCGAWDYLASLSVRDDIPPTPPRRRRGRRATSERAGGSGEAAPWREVARFITPYHREAHWVVASAPLLAMVKDGGTRALRWDFAPEWNTQPTATWLALRLSNRGRGVRPVSAVPLFQGGDFGSHYNDRTPVTVEVAETTRAAEIWALVTGHGSGPNQCAEFCNHLHAFSIAEARWYRGFTEAGSEDGCMPAIAHGMTPNQGGTWWFGRGGWCPGAPVEPWIVDVSAEARPGAPVAIGYQGLLGGKSPPDGSGSIVLTSYLVSYE